MDKFLVKGGVGKQQGLDRYGSRAAGVSDKKRQLKLSDCKKVVLLENCTGVGFSLESLQGAQRVLEAAFAPGAQVSDDEVLLALRTLSSLKIGKEALLENPIGAPVRQARKHANPEIKQMAENLIEKWKAVVLDSNRVRSSRKQDFFGGRAHKRK